jgi:phenylpropionate dioxygenase-like ring-hydroxylating dioxygenase large terminal subunit
MEAPQSASQEQVWKAWPRYRAAALGFRNYWYPVMAARSLGKKPRAITLCGEQIVLVRDRGRAYALHDRCAHRGVPFSVGRCEFPGLLTCPYHGWSYDLETGELAVVLTDGPDSPVVGKANVQVKTYPVEERAGLLWVYVGEEPAPPVEADIPAELLQPDAVINALFEVRKGNWRYAVENAVDEGHAKYLHRNALWALFSEFPAWTKGVGMQPSEDGLYLMRIREKSLFQDTYPRIGVWPKTNFWRSRNRGPSISLGMRLPCLSRVVQGGGWTDYEIFVPVDADHHLAVFLATKWTSGLGAWLWRLRYWLYIRLLYYGLLNRAQDQWMIELMNIPPERLYRPDVSITAWRRWCEEQARDTDSRITARTAPASRP